MTGLRNFRDIAASAGNGRLRRDILFRSAHLARLDEASTADITTRPWAAIVDLRYPDEQRRDPSPWPETFAARRLSVGRSAATDAPHHAMMDAARGGGGRIEEAYRSFYAALPHDPLYRPLFVEAARVIGESDGPVLIHCTAGKDRTGVLAALLMKLLGLSNDEIIADYLLSSAIATEEFIAEIRRRDAATDASPLGDDAIQALLGVEPSYLEAAFAAIAAGSGSVEGYFLEHGLSANDLARFRARLAA
ncbi:tyrosine-protein phosphatase [Sphingopyxis sp.]|uniref:tyrosine-protein phosphatase n=1 Tax=Sphingopyxis sp. TaxID=1908224 RepID=UPI002B473597|nr:tyrosine-protein phosphatase [Sphingopyxis sp.]HJS10544.1 tyrosine-protein phosphatase [Sphingopyxis sp.]